MKTMRKRLRKSPLRNHQSICFNVPYVTIKKIPSSHLCPLKWTNRRKVRPFLQYEYMENFENSPRELPSSFKVISQKMF